MMGYDVYVTRATSWLEKKAFPISQQEWHEVIKSDSELEVSATDYYDRKTAKGVERTYFVFWIRPEDSVPLLFLDGAIEVKNPDEPTIQKLVQIAARLSARVLGDDDEEYGSDGRPKVTL